MCPEIEECGIQWNAVETVRGMFYVKAKAFWSLKDTEGGEPIKENDFITGRPLTP